MGMPSSKKDYSLLREATVDHLFPVMSQSSEKQRKAQKASHKRLWESSETLSGQMLQTWLLWADGPSAHTMHNRQF